MWAPSKTKTLDEGKKKLPLGINRTANEDFQTDISKEKNK
jgi:hypothetical protein